MMKILGLFACLLVLLVLTSPVSAEINITGADEIIHLTMKSRSIPTNKTNATGIFISGVDSVENIGLSPVEIPTNKTPLTGIFISGEDAVSSFSLADLWKGNASIAVESHYHGQTVYTSFIVVEGTAFDESGIVSVRVN
ncbi:MAG: hypothetical protein DRN66_03645, partial [Candidatus Nanohalarchaeota archaeon]